MAKQKRMLKELKRHSDDRVRWICTHTPEAAEIIVAYAIDIVHDMPRVTNTTEDMIARQSAMFETVQACRRHGELTCGLSLDASSSSQLQWIIERAIGDIAAYIFDRRNSGI